MQFILLLALVLGLLNSAWAAEQRPTKDIKASGDGSTCDPVCDVKKPWTKCVETRCTQVKSPCTYQANAPDSDQIYGGQPTFVNCNYDTEICILDKDHSSTASGSAFFHKCLLKDATETCTPACGSAERCKLGKCFAILAELGKLPADIKSEFDKLAVDSSTFDHVRKISRSGVLDATKETSITNNLGDTDTITLDDREVVKFAPDAVKLATLKFPSSLVDGGAAVIEDGADLAITTMLDVKGDKFALVIGKNSKVDATELVVAAGKTFEVRSADKQKRTLLKKVDLADKDAVLKLSGGKVDVDVASKSKDPTTTGTFELSDGVELNGNTGKYLLDVTSEVGEAKMEIGIHTMEGNIVGSGVIEIKGAGKKLTMTGAATRVSAKISVEEGGHFKSTSTTSFDADKVAIKGKFEVNDNEAADVGKNFVQNVEECSGEVILKVATQAETTKPSADSKSKTVFKYSSVDVNQAKRDAFTCAVKVTDGTNTVTAKKVSAFDASSTIAAKYATRRLLQTDCVLAVWGENSLEVAQGPCPPETSAASSAVVSILAFGVAGVLALY